MFCAYQKRFSMLLGENLLHKEPFGRFQLATFAFKDSNATLRLHSLPSKRHLPHWQHCSPIDGLIDAWSNFSAPNISAFKSILPIEGIHTFDAKKYPDLFMHQYKILAFKIDSLKPSFVI